METRPCAIHNDFTHICFMSPTAHVVFYRDVFLGLNTWVLPPTSCVRYATPQEQALLNVVFLVALRFIL